MAENSKREQIAAYVVTLLEGLDSIKTVERTKLNYSRLEQFSDPQIPVAAVVAGFPVPKEKVSGKDNSVDLIVSELTVKILVYGRDKENPDILASNLADDVWAKLYSDQTFGGLILGMRLVFDSDPQFWEPYVAFQLNCIVRYKHYTGGI